jgi:hypothetical protein
VIKKENEDEPQPEYGGENAGNIYPIPDREEAPENNGAIYYSGAYLSCSGTFRCGNVA